MKNDCPIVSVRRCARSRAAMSGAPPGGIVTSTLTGRVGYCWPSAPLARNDASGKAIVQIDEVVSKLKEGRPGAMVAPIWTTEGFPVNNDGHDDAATRPVGTTLPGGTILRVVEFSPGVQSRNHRTDSIDYAIIMSGEIDMEMDGAMIHLKAGDVLVQRGTIHNWINKGTAPCVIAFALIDGKPVRAGGKVLSAVG